MKLFCKKTLLSSALLALGVSNIHAQSTNHNYVLTKEPLVSTTDTAQLNGNPKFENISYFDGLGRPTVSITKPNTEKALATKVTYDGFGRTDKEYLPGVVAGINFPSTINYSNYPETGKVYAQKEYENSPLSRVLKQGAPGEIWKVEGNNNIKFQYQTNTSNEVLNFGVSLDNNYVPTLVLNNYYSAGSLYKTITIDENGQPIQEYKDKEGKIILKRINIKSKADFPKNSNGDHDTYYVYDIYGNLTYVLPPQLVKSAGKSVSVSDYINHLPELGYQYQYDEKNRLVEKQLPGKGREFMVYDKEDRLVLYQDINMRNGSVNTTSENTTLNKGWTFTKYDKFGRILYTGYFKNTADRKAMEAALKNKTTPNNEVKSSTGFTNNGLRIYYTTNEFPKSSLIVHTVNYYDNYEFLELKPSDLNEQSLVNELDQELKGISVATFSNILGTNTWNKNFTFFENKYLRPVITTQLNYNGGKTETKTEYDSFRGKVVSTTTTHQLSLDTEPVIVKESFKYNPDESIQYQTHQINDGPEEYIVRNEYNDIKQLVRKKIGNSSLNSPLEQVDYKFNIRGWLTDINSIENTSDRLFSFKIKYHDSERGDNPYNGNIGETLWKINNGATKSYAYHYDGLNRLLLGKSTEVSNSIVSTNQYDERIYGYDFNGNILGLSRNTIGHELSLNGIQSIDQLEYQYKPNSNQLESVNDLTSNEQGFNDKNTTGADYEYDLNGNLKKDLNKNITNIAYNHLNLPIEVLFNNNGELSKIQFLYDASGVKVSKLVNDNLLIPYSENTFYDNGFQYKQSAGRGNNLSLQFFPTAEGYVNVNEGIFEYVYNYTDHLGNVRVSYTKGEDGNRKIVDENSYYPFGLKHNNQSIVNTANPNYKYKYNGKELQDDLGLNWHDYGWRNYDASIGRWLTPDPLFNDLRTSVDYSRIFEDDESEIDLLFALKNKLEIGDGVFNTDNLNVYSYGYNNPILFDDPDGRCPKCVKAVVKTGIKSVAKGKIDLAEVYDAVDNVKTIINPNASLLDKGIAVFDLVSPVSSKELKAGKKVLDKTIDGVKTVNGNSKASTKAQHVYEIFEVVNPKNIVKTGISSGRETAKGKSYRGTNQANKWNKEDKQKGKYDSRIIERIPAGPGARQKALDSEKLNADKNRSTLDPKRHKRP